MTIYVKRWTYEQEQEKAQKYNFRLCGGKGIVDVDDREQPETCYFYGKVERKTEKAFFCTLLIWNLNKNQNAPAENRWKCWIPRSAVMGMQL